MPFLGTGQRDEIIAIKCKVKDSVLVEEHMHQTQIITIDIPKLTDLPTIMRKMGWTVASALMDRWFNSKEFVLSRELRSIYYRKPTSIPIEHFDDKIVTMEWFMKFPRASEFVDNCHNQLITSNSTRLCLH